VAQKKLTYCSLDDKLTTGLYKTGTSAVLR